MIPYVSDEIFAHLLAITLSILCLILIYLNTLDIIKAIKKVKRIKKELENSPLAKRRKELQEMYLIALKETAYNYFISTGNKSITLTFNPYTKKTSMEDPILVTRIRCFRRKRK